MLELKEFFKIISEENPPGLGAPPSTGGSAAPSDAPPPSGSAGSPTDALGAGAPAGLPSPLGGGPSLSPSSAGAPSDPMGLGSPTGGATPSGDAKTAPINLKTGFDALDFYFNKKNKT